MIFVKRMLQVGLVEELRNRIVDQLFEKHVGMSEKAFSRELYMNSDQLKMMKQLGMHIGSHGFDHYWLNSLSKEEQENEVLLSLDFLREINGSTDSWTMCYPYGGYNQDTIDILKRYGCKLALTTKVDIANLSNENRYTLERLDTNDLPKDSNAKTDKWIQINE